MSFDVSAVRRDFPILSRQVAGRPLVYFDSAATSLKPRPVIEAVVGYMQHSTANIHRAKHLLSQEASGAFEDAREKVARFLGTESRATVFTRGTTDAINLVASGLRLAPDDNVVGSVLEHHSNILPWSSRCQYRSAPLGADGLPDLEVAGRLIDARTRLIAVTHCSNVTGACVPVERWAALARARGVPLLVDAAQSGGHGPIDVGAMGADFVALSGHKMLGPTGVGVLTGRIERLEALDPVNLGGGAVSLVRADHSYVLRELPWRLEPGTPDIAAVIGLGAAVDYLEGLGRASVAAWLDTLRTSLDAAFEGLDGITSVATPRGLPRACIQSFYERSGVFPADYLTRILSDTYGIMARAGHHCAHPLHDHLGLTGTARMSLHLYNTVEEIEYAAAALRAIARMADH